MKTAHEGDPRTCPACAEIMAMMKSAMSFEMKELILETLKREQARCHGQKTESNDGLVR